MEENERIEFWCIYKVKDKFQFKQKDKQIIKLELTQHWFAQFVSKELRDYLNSSGCKKIKYGNFVTENKKVAEGFKAVAERMKETLETSLFHSKKLADKRKDIKRAEKIQMRTNYLKKYFEKRIKPIVMVFKIKRVVE